MKKDSIVKKLIVTFTSITGGVLILVGLIISFWVNKAYNSMRIVTLEEQLNIVEKSVGTYLKQQGGSYEELEKQLKLASLATYMDAIIIDRLGYVYMVSNPAENHLKYSKIEIPEELKSTFEIAKIKKEPLPVYRNGKVKTYIKPIYNNNSLDGYIIMNTNDNYGGNSIMIIIWISVVVAMIIAGVIVKYFAQKLVIRPLDAINNAAKKLAKGEVEKRVEIISNDEIGELAESFNYMAEALEKVDNTRKEFISNVSHELRSPITSIKGFVGGILDGVIPKDRENYYLKIVYDEINRLARLVNDLLDISAMEAGKFNLQKVEFDINCVISLCILNLEGKIKSKGLNVRAIFDEKRNYVIGDRDRIIQVTTNLLENAIKYSYENGNIEVNVYNKGEKTYVSIFNTGDNLSKEDMINIWDRFYKGDKARTNKISMGLGLPIVRLILSQHNEDIWAKNIDEKGVEFVFTLTKS